MRESSQQLERLAKQIGPSSVEKARPYYDARMRARRAHAEAQRAALRFDKINIPKISFLTKFTFSKTYFSQNQHF